MVLDKNTLAFLSKLKRNNNRDWFLKHKAEYLSAKENFDQFINALLRKIAAYDKSVSSLEAKDCVFRIYRDIRFSKDKTPYKTHFGAHIVPGGKKMEDQRAGYYVHIEPGDCFLAGGAYHPPGPWIQAIRQEIDYNTKEFKKILSAKPFKTLFGKMEGEKLARPPKGYEKDHPEIELLKHKSFLAVHTLRPGQVTSKGFSDYCAKVFKALKPFDDFLNRSTD